MNIDLSIIVPVYNSEKYLENCIMSIVNQTQVELRIEIIIIDDGSKDNSKFICEKLKFEYSNIIYKYINNSGVSHARNEALKLANGKYVMFVDSDDELKLNALELIYSFLNEKNDLVIAGYNRVNINNGKVISKIPKSEIYVPNSFNNMIEELQPNNLLNQLWNKIFKMDIIKKYNLFFDENKSLGEDYSFVLDYIEKCNTIVTVHEIIYNYKNRFDGLNMTYRKDRLAINLLNMSKLEYMYKNNQYNMAYVKRKYLKTIISGIGNLNRIKDKKERKEKLKKIKNDDKILEIIRTNSDSKLLIFLFSLKSYYFIKMVAIFANGIDKLHKKYKLGY